MRLVVSYKPESQMGWNALVALYTKMQGSGASDPKLADKLAEAQRRAAPATAKPR